jgi:uncharacterized membrane protein YtjA (UPF0391 family)
LPDLHDLAANVDAGGLISYSHRPPEHFGRPPGETVFSWIRPLRPFDAGRSQRHGCCSTKEGRRVEMLYYALVFLIVGLVAGALGLFGVAQVASQIAWVLFLVGIILVVVHLVSGRRAPLP